MSRGKSTNRELRYRRYLHPRWWPTWLGIAVMWLLARLPLRLQWWLGTLVGELAYWLIPRRRHITEVNIGLCFPELSAAARRSLVRRSFHSNGIGIMEIGLAWFRNPAAFQPVTTVHGLEHVRAALAQGNGALALGGHYSSLDLCGILVRCHVDADVMQRDHNNPLLNAVMTRARERQDGIALSAKDLRGLLRQLGRNRLIWYATDQDYGRKDAVFAPFFGIPAASITTTSRIAARSGCKVVPFSHFRRQGSPGYDIYFHPALDNFPSGDDLADATLVNQVIEREVRRHPDQYLWMHRRFKTRPDPQEPGFY